MTEENAKNEQKNEELSELDKSIDEQSNDSENSNIGTSIDEMGEGRNYVPTVKVGEQSEWLTVTNFVAREPTENKDEAGDTFTDALKVRNPKRGQKEYAYYLMTDKGDYRISAWEVFFKITALKKLLDFGKWKEAKFEMKIFHNFDGMSKSEEVKAAKNTAKLFEVQVKVGDKIKKVSQKLVDGVRKYELEDV